MTWLTKNIIRKNNVLVFCLALFSINGIGQNMHSLRNIDSTEQINNLDSLNIKFGINKEIPNDLNLISLIALSYYPELRNQRIIFKNARIKTTLNARPIFFSLFHFKKSKRKYIIRINCSKKVGQISIYQVCFNGKIGLLGHEFAHITDYQSKTFFGILKRAFSYLSDKSKTKFEHEIDNLTIKRGLGWQLYDWSFYVLNQSNASDVYKEFKRKIYLTPEQILINMQQNGSIMSSN